MHINVCSPQFDPCDSYGQIAQVVAGAFEAAGYTVNRIGDDAPDVPLQPTLGGIVLGYPTNFKHFGRLANTGPRIAVTMFESTRLPSGWAEALNQCDLVVVPSQFQVDVFRQSGVNATLQVIPLGVKKAFYEVKRREPSEPFTFLTIGDRGHRKSWMETAQAFERAFKSDRRYQLLIKVRKATVRFQNSNIHVVEGDYSDEDMLRLYQRAHVMVFASKGEGFGLPPREFAASGGVALATRWGGLKDDLEHWGVPVPHTMERAWQYRPDWKDAPLGQWAKPDDEALSHQMRFVAEHYPVYADQAIRAAGFVQAHYRWSRFTSALIDAWQWVLDQRKAQQVHQQEVIRPLEFAKGAINGNH